MKEFGASGESTAAIGKEQRLEYCGVYSSNVIHDMNITLEGLGGYWVAASG
jgi:hypothetical protein